MLQQTSIPSGNGPIHPTQLLAKDKQMRTLIGLLIAFLTLAHVPYVSRADDIAKFGQLYLQRGNWQGQQLVPAQWIQQATSKQVSNGSDPDRDWDQGYGFQFWRCRHDAYRGDGKDGQYCIVLPQHNTVIAITANTRDMQGALNIVWDKLLPVITDQPLAEDLAEHAALSTVISQLQQSR